MDSDISGLAAKTSKASGAFVCLCLVAMLSLAGCDAENLFGGDSSDTDTALRILDPSASVLVHINVEKGIDTLMDEFSPTSEEQGELDEVMNRVAEMLGINPQEDIHHIYIAISAFSNLGDSTLGYSNRRDSTLGYSAFAPTFGMVVLTDFDQEKLIARLASEMEVQQVRAAGKSAVYQIAGEKGAQFSLVDGKMILLSNDTAYLSRMTDKALDDDAMVPQKDDLQKRVGKMESWVVVRDLGKLHPEMNFQKLDGDLAQALRIAKTIDAVAMGLSTTGNDLEGVLFIQPQVGVDAEDIANVLGGLRAAARLQLQDQPELLDRVEDIDIETVKNLVKVSGETSKEDIRSFFSAFAERSNSF